MIVIWLLILYRYTGVVTQYGKYHLFPPFSASKDNSVSCETSIREISDSSNHSNLRLPNGFGIILAFNVYPSVFNVEKMIDAQTMNNHQNFSLKYNYTDFSQTPNYPVVVNTHNRTSKYKISITCYHGNSGMDLRDRLREYYLPCYFILFIPMFIAAFRQTDRKNLRIICIIVCIFYFLSVFFRYLTLIVSMMSYDASKNYVNSNDFIITADVISSITRVFCWTILLTNCCHPVFIDPDFQFKNVLISVFILNILFEIVDTLLFVDVFPFLEEETISKKYFSWISTSFKNIKIVFWSMFAVFPIQLIFVFIKALSFLPKTRSKFTRRSVKVTMWLIIVTSYVLYISGRLGVYFAMINGGFTALTNLIVDTTDFFFPSLTMGVIYHFEKSRKIYSETLRKRREKRNQQKGNQSGPKDDNDKNSKKRPLVDPNPLNESFNYNQMNEPLLLNSYTNSMEANTNLA